EATLHSVVGDPGEVTDEWVWEEYRINNSSRADASFEALARYFETQLDADVTGPRLASLTTSIPTLLIWGGDDRAVPPEYGHAARESLGNVELMTIPAAGHAPYFEAPDAFNEIVLTFLRDKAT